MQTHRPPCSALNPSLRASYLDGVCCNTACGGACDACNLSGTIGTCTNIPAGSTGSPSCSPYLCSGAAASGPTRCTADSQFVAGQHCNASSCVPKKTDGTPASPSPDSTAMSPPACRCKPIAHPVVHSILPSALPTSTPSAATPPAAAPVTPATCPVRMGPAPTSRPARPGARRVRPMSALAQL